MRVKFITYEGLLKAKSNFAQIQKSVITKKEQTLVELFDDESMIKNTSIEIDDFELDMSHDKPPMTDTENVRRIYGRLKDVLSESQASDERIWVAYTLSECVDYMRYRWMPENETDKLDRFFFNNSGKRSLFRNGIARLWWIGYHTYDSSRTDPYELTAFVCSKQDIINQLMDIGFASNKTITKAVLDTIYDADKHGKAIDRDLMRGISQYINLLGGVYVLDCLSYDEICEKIIKKFEFNK